MNAMALRILRQSVWVFTAHGIDEILPAHKGLALLLDTEPYRMPWQKWWAN